MGTEKGKWARVLDELDICAKLVAVWVILKGVEMAGRVLVRQSRNGNTTIVTFQMLGWAAVNGNSVYGCERMTGWGYNRTGMGISKILTESHDKLNEEYAIEITGQDWEVQSRWEKDITAAGYKVIRVI